MRKAHKKVVAYTALIWLSITWYCADVKVENIKVPNTLSTVITRMVEFMTTPADFPASFTQMTPEQMKVELEWQTRIEEARLKLINNTKN